MRGVVLAALLLPLLIGCGRPEMSASSTRDPALAAGIQTTLDRLAALLRSGSSAEVSAVSDGQDRVAPLLLKLLVEDAQQPGGASADPAGFTIVNLQPRGDGLAEAILQRPWDGRHVRWVFRAVDGIWLVSQPTGAEVGGEQVLQGDGFRIVFRTWDADLAARLLPLLTAGFTEIAGRLGVADPAPFTVDLRPRADSTRALDRGLYVPGATPAGDTLILSTSGIVFGAFDPAQSWPEALAQVARHEYTHRLQDRAAVPVSLAATPLWFSEGLAEALAGSEHLRVPAFRAVIDQEGLLSFCDLAAPPLHTERGVLYGTAQLAVTYMIEERGGLAAFWELMQHYTQTSPSQRARARMDTALQATWQESCAEIDHAWHAWIRDRRVPY